MAPPGADSRGERFDIGLIKVGSPGCKSTPEAASNHHLDGALQAMNRAVRAETRRQRAARRQLVGRSTNGHRTIACSRAGKDRQAVAVVLQGSSKNSPHCGHTCKGVPGKVFLITAAQRPGR